MALTRPSPAALSSFWAASHPDPGPRFTGPDVPSDGSHPPQVWKVLNLASDEAHALNHHWISDDHLVLGMLHLDCPGAARAALESFGIRPEPLRQDFIASMGDPYDTPVTHRTIPPATWQARPLSAKARELGGAVVRREL